MVITAPFWLSDNGETTLTLYQGDVLDVLRQMPAEFVHCVVTSPPYWGLRDYGVDGQLGLEKTPEEYIDKMVSVFRELRRMLRRDGTLWLNMGDGYASGDRATYRSGASENKGHQIQDYMPRPGNPPGLKPKDLLGMPWRVAFALQADGWWLRSDIIWSKPNPMPESVTDRPTKSHEFLFLLAKSERYFYDAMAITEPVGAFHAAGISNGVDAPRGPDPRKKQDALGKNTYTGFNDRWREHPTSTRNRRTVWEIPTEPYSEAHFATFPQKLVEPCLLAGTSEKGCCPACGAPWKRIVVAEGGTIGQAWHPHTDDAVEGQRSLNTLRDSQDGSYRRVEVGWRPTCTHGQEPIPATILDPFAGSGTTLLVAQRLGRHAVGIELNPDYCAMAVKRLEAEHRQQKLQLESSHVAPR